MSSKIYESSNVKAVDWQNGELLLLDQRKLPNEEVYLNCCTVEDVYESIKSMVVRGAPAIGICAAYGVVISASHHVTGTSDVAEKIISDIEHLKTARPTAVNLEWALNEMKITLTEQSEGMSLVERLLRRAKSIHMEDIDNNYHMSELACDVLRQHSEQSVTVMTHCNAGSLATGGYGTALGVVRTAWRNKLVDLVYADETRPWLQGARLTAWELMKDGVPVTLNAEGAASWIIKNKGVSWVIVGADRVASNGDVVNKIGTYSLAIQARYHGAKVMVVAPSSTVDMGAASGDDVEIEMRDMDELRQVNGFRISSPDVPAINPVFDVTPADLVDYLVTEKGVISQPNLDKMNTIFAA